MVKGAYKLVLPALFVDQLDVRIRYVISTPTRGVRLIWHLDGNVYRANRPVVDFAEEGKKSPLAAILYVLGQSAHEIQQEDVTHKYQFGLTDAPQHLDMLGVFTAYSTCSTSVNERLVGIPLNLVTLQAEQYNKRGFNVVMDYNNAAQQEETLV